jgi:hypothetical protein
MVTLRQRFQTAFALHTSTACALRLNHGRCRYSTGPKIRATDVAINEVPPRTRLRFHAPNSSLNALQVFKRFVKDPVFVIVEVNSPDDVDIPTKV